MSPAYKPGSVDTPRCIGRSFLSASRHRHAPAAYPRFAVFTRRCNGVVETGRLSPPIWPCSERGLPSHACYQTRGGLLPHPFTLTAFLRRRRFAFCCTVRRTKLAPRAPRGYLAICPVEPGLSSEPGRDHEGPSPGFATVRPTTSVPRNLHAADTAVGIQGRLVATDSRATVAGVTRPVSHRSGAPDSIRTPPSDMRLTVRA